MLPVMRYTLSELKTLFQRSWEWRIGYVIIAGFILARWLGFFSSFEFIALDFFLRNRPSEGKDKHIVLILIERDSLQKTGNLSDDKVVELLTKVLATKPTVVGLNIFRDEFNDTSGRNALIELFEKNKNLIGVQKVLPPNRIPPIGNISEDIRINQFGLNDIPLDQDGRIRRVFVGAFLPDEEAEDGTNPFQFSFSFKVAEKYLTSRGYSLDSLPSDPETPIFRRGNSRQFVRIPWVKERFGSFGGYIRESSIAEVQTMLNFRTGAKTFEIIDSQEILESDFNSEKLSSKAVIISGLDSFSPQRFLSVPASSNLIGRDEAVLPRIGITGAELEAHAVSQIINSVISGRPMISVVHPLFEDLMIVLAGIGGILVGNAFKDEKAILRNALTLISISILFLGMSYLLMWQLGIWLPIFATSTVLAVTGTTYIAFYQSEKSALTASRKLEEERRKTIERTFNSIHAGPLQTLAGVLRNVKDGKLDQPYLIKNLTALNKEIRSIGERLRQDAIEDVYFIDVRRDTKLDLTHPMHEVLYEVYSLCTQQDLPGFQTIKVRSVSFEPFNCKLISLEIKRKLCLFLQESLENVGKHAPGTTRLIVTGKVFEEFYTICVEDNGPGVTSQHIGEGTHFFYRLEELLKGKFSRVTKPSGGTLCKLTWALSTIRK